MERAEVEKTKVSDAVFQLGHDSKIMDRGTPKGKELILALFQLGHDSKIMESRAAKGTAKETLRGFNWATILKSWKVITTERTLADCGRFNWATILKSWKVGFSATEVSNMTVFQLGHDSKIMESMTEHNIHEVELKSFNWATILKSWKGWTYLIGISRQK